MHFLSTYYFFISDQPLNRALRFSSKHVFQHLESDTIWLCACWFLLLSIPFIHFSSIHHIVIDGICTFLILIATLQALLFSSHKNFPTFEVLSLFIIFWYHHLWKPLGTWVAVFLSISNLDSFHNDFKEYVVSPPDTLFS